MAKGKVGVKKIATTENPTNMMTKYVILVKLKPIYK